MTKKGPKRVQKGSKGSKSDQKGGPGGVPGGVPGGGRRGGSEGPKRSKNTKKVQKVTFCPLKKGRFWALLKSPYNFSVLEACGFKIGFYSPGAFFLPGIT